MKTISQKITTLFLICLISLAITGYTYSHWTDITTILGTVNMAHLEITIDKEKLIPDTSYFKYPDNKTVYISATITTGWEIWVGITIKNIGNLPVTITYEVTANKPNLYFSNETHFYGPYTTVPPEVWCDLNQTNPPPPLSPPPPGETTQPIDLPVGDKLVVWQKIRVETTPPNGYTITITSDYLATFGWHDTVAVIYHLTKG
jgi:hypothetical protein